jgi:autotransporter-associated beta strand protein
VIANASITKTGSGALTLTGASTYSGNTTIDGGSLVVSTATATLGTSAVSVLSTAINLTIQTGVTNALGNSSVLSLAGGGTAGAADFGFANLGAGVNETVGGLILGGNQVALGTYGSTDSPAEFKLNEFFSGTGIITVVPEPGAVVMLLSGLGMLGLMRRRSRA